MAETDKEDYFALFGLSRSYTVDLRDIQDRYRRLQRTVHPDRYAAAGDREQRLAAEHSSRINDAYNTLRSPVARARYLLESTGAEMPAESDSFSDTSFLMEQMRLRETLQEVDEAANPDTALAALFAELDALFDGIQSDFERDWLAQDLSSAVDKLARLQFLQRFREQVALKEDQLLEG